MSGAQVESRRRSGPVDALVGALGVIMIGLGLFGWLAPAAFARMTAFPLHVHFLHDAGVFQIGIGLSLVAALRLRDPVAVVLAGFLVANTLHAANHAVDLPLGGHWYDGIGLGLLSVVAAVALILRLRSATRGGPQ